LAGDLLEKGSEIRPARELPGYGDVAKTVICVRVLGCREREGVSGRAGRPAGLRPPLSGQESEIFVLLNGEQGRDLRGVEICLDKPGKE